MTGIGFALVMNSSLPHYAVRIMLGGAICVIAILVFSAPLHKRYHFTKKSFFGLISTLILSVTLALVATHVALISQSQNGTISRQIGQLSVVACGQEIEISPSSRFSSSAGSGSYSISSNGTMQYLGYERDVAQDGTLGSFFQSAGASISSNVVTLPYGSATRQKLTNDTTLGQFSRINPLGENYLELRSGESCSIAPSMVSIYVHHYDVATKKYETKHLIQHPEQYVLSDMPSDQRDCIVVVFDDPKNGASSTCKGYPESELLSPIVKDVSL